MPKPFKLATAVVAVLSVAAAARGDILITNGPLTVDADSSSGVIPLGRGAYSSGTHSLLHGLATGNLQEPSVLWQVLATLKPGQGVSTPHAINGRASIRGAWVAYATAVPDRRPLVMGSLDSPAVVAAGAAPPDIAGPAGRFPALAPPAHGLWKFAVTGTGDGPDATDSDADIYLPTSSFMQ